MHYSSIEVHQKQKAEFHPDLTQPHLKWWLRIGESSNIDPSWLHIRFTKKYHEIQFQFIDTLHRNIWIHFLVKTPRIFSKPRTWNTTKYEDMSMVSTKKNWLAPDSNLPGGRVFLGFSGSTKDATWAWKPNESWPLVLVIFREVGSENGMISFCCYAIMKSIENDKLILIATRNCMVSTGMRIHCDWSEGLRVCHLEWVVHSGVWIQIQNDLLLSCRMLWWLP